MDEQKVWDLRAKTFPRYSPGQNNYEAKILELAHGIGVDFSDKTILDVGCGAGMYTLRLAKMGQFVTALDISKEMIAINEKDAQREKITNIEYLNIDWLNFEPKRSYDIVFCAMTPAVKSVEGKFKLLTFPKAQVVYVGYSKPMNNRVLNAFSEEFGLELKPSGLSEQLKMFLEVKCVKFKTAQLSGRWDLTHSRDDFIVNLTSMVLFHGGSLKNLKLDSFIDKFADITGYYKEIIDYESEIVVWDNI
ncbi:MAG: methyltransferase domain-containing protein [Deltaproteobacteria bacterium]|jgi:SAM-dependent methyltransferase|nr:methyltransferase domain-containing protein [Deltaproteobacteria bacterium]